MGAERGQGACWLGRRASEQTSWRRRESQVGWSRREECRQYLRQGQSLGRGVAGEHTGEGILPGSPLNPCASLRLTSPGCPWEPPEMARCSHCRWDTGGPKGGHLAGMASGSHSTAWPAGSRGRQQCLGSVWGRGSTRRVRGSGHQLVRPVFQCSPGCEPRTWNSRRTHMTT